MSQKEVLNILRKIGGRASSSEIRQQAKQDFPDRQLFAYTSLRLESLQKRNLVSKEEANGENHWVITKEGQEKSLEKRTIEDSCDQVYKKMLTSEGIEIVNIVSVVYNEEDVYFDLYDIYNGLSNSVYNRENDGYLTFYPPECENATIRIPSSGTLNITGTRSKKEVYNGLSAFEDKMEGLGYNIDISPEDIEIQNIVGTSNIQKEIDLKTLASDMPDSVEYNTDNSAALIFRPNTQGTIMMYRTGKIVATGLKTYEQMASLYKQLNDEMPPVENSNVAFS